MKTDMRASILALDASSTNMNCNIDNLPGNCDGTITVSVIGGDAPYTYEIVSLSNTITVSDDTYTFTNICSGSYTINVYDANFIDYNTTPDNYNIISASVSQPAPLNIVIMSTNASCYGMSNGEIDIVVLGGGSGFYFYNWTGPNSFTSAVEDISGLISGDYNLTVTDENECLYTNQVNLVSPSPISITTDSIYNELCENNDGFINISISDEWMEYDYNWENNIYPGDTISTQQDIDSLSAGTYNLTVTNENGCQESDAWIINEISQLNISETHVNPSCFGESNGEINLSVSCGTPPYTFFWENSENQGVSINTDQNLTNLLAGTYCVTVTDSLLSADTLCITLTEPSLLTVSASVFNSHCGNNDGSIILTPSGGSTPYTYEWIPEIDNVSTVSNLFAGSYHYTVSDHNGCTYTDVANVLDYDGVHIDNIQVTQPSCFDECSGIAQFSIIGTPPYTYKLYDGTNVTDLDNSFAVNLCVGSYSLVVEDSFNCLSSTTFQILNPTELEIELDTSYNVSCFGGSDAFINVTTTGGTLPYSFNWVGSDSFTSEDEDISELQAGIYYVTVTDANNCYADSTLVINQPDSIEIYVESFSEPTNGVCNGHISVSPLNGTEPYTYFWNNTEGTSTLNDLCNDTYNLLVLDSNNCEATESYNLDLVFNNEDPDILDTIEMTVEACIFDFFTTT